MKFKTISVSNIWGALHGMRNPKDSWALSDTLTYTVDQNVETVAKLWSTKTDKNPNPMIYDDAIDWLFAQIRDGNRELIGPNDMRLAQQLIKAGPEHRKFMRQIFVSVDITAPLYWWKEFDTYKVGTVANSTSTMHKMAAKPITIDCFETDDYQEDLGNYFDGAVNIPGRDGGYLAEDVQFIIDLLENLRQTYLETKDVRYWKELIRWLPESWLQTRTVTLNYENIRSMVHQRRGHKLTEWRKTFINWVTTLSYANELIFYNNN